jgi:predicted Zn finger-like uncharacterized protein
MIIACPSCSSRYPVNAASFEPSGRKVRCAKCGHSWHQEPESAQANAPAEELVPSAVGQKKIFGEKTKPAPESAGAGDAKKPEAESDDADDVVFADAPPPAANGTGDIGNRFRAEVKREASLRRSRVAIAVGWVLLVAFVAGTLGAGYAYRHEIAALWPATTKVYAAAGEEINLRGLEFHNVSYERQTEEGLPVLAIAGEVVNITGERVVLPRLRVGLRDEHQNELYHWTFALEEKALQPQGSASFITRLSSPPPESRDIEIRFAEKMDMAAAASPGED